MSLKDSIAGELKRSPMAALSGVASFIVALLTLGVGWLQNRSAGTPGPTSAARPDVLTGDLFTGNVFLVVAYFLAITTAASLLLRAIARKHDIAALFVSVPLIALSNFSVILMMYLAPPRPISAQLFASAHDLVFYASAAVVIAFCGRAVLADLVSTTIAKNAESENRSTSKSNDAVGFLLIALLLLAVWGWLVFAGQTRLTRTLLPEVTHPSDVKPTGKVSSPALPSEPQPAKAAATQDAKSSRKAAEAK